MTRYVLFKISEQRCGSGSTLKEAFFIKHGVSASSNLAAILGIKYNKKDS